MPRHAFLLNAHKDLDQLARTTRLLQDYFAQSHVYIYYDGPASDGNKMRELPCNFRQWRNEEPDKVQSTLNALSHLLTAAWERDIQTASFMHADMIPTDKNQFYRFIDRFARSEKAVTHASMWPGNMFVDFCNLTFNVREAFAAKLFPVEPMKLIEPHLAHANEAHLTLCWDQKAPSWRKQLTYPIWTIVFPYSGQTDIWKHGHNGKGQYFTFHNFTPESSVIHVNDPEFWGNVKEFVQWD